ncbi:Add37p [Kluyveromyces lactis]|uniref:KLLA0D08954p n=1 Tax=Kluyveromyces lactis (strain ATCC 8585 / CBS 2359 / DSM 70799 / NBRC 1267 / NRRL Y-1140 / WM37) TaxID=284590 RepID=Q6CRH8_KLULA|nr:uncharacterized protein KLLA0_D08954g [Kluyveromyces lactis]CAH00557.1 KLLA0D08954p [Kluyveromyces lactis]|eukprot:XP_453461.1 uncharacterized protein KLLA0_D08954g [Kluyveromyces lactis]
MESSGMNRTRSFQNCRETEIPGYNDCPSFIYPGAASIAPKRIVSQSVDTSGNTRMATVPPPSMKRKVSEKLRSTESLDTSIVALSKQELSDKYQWITSLPSNLQDKEFSFYKTKVDKVLENVLENEGTRYALSEIFANLNDSKRVTDLITKWMLSDMSVNSWCPSFRKLIENAQI